MQDVAPSFGWYVPLGHGWQRPDVKFLNCPDMQPAAEVKKIEQVTME